VNAVELVDTLVDAFVGLVNFLGEFAVHCLDVCVCVCVCKYKRMKEREKESERERD